MSALGRAGVVAALAAALAGACPAVAGEEHASARPNIVLLNIDMLRADHLGVYGYKRPTTTNLDRMARGGVWFSDARSHSSWTYPSVTSLFTGLYPSSHGARYTQKGDQYYTTALAPSLRTLPMLLHEQGYTTAAFLTNPLLKRFSGLARGFDVFRDDFVSDWSREGPADWWLEKMTAENVHREVLAWLDQNPKSPFFLYIHYIDVHGPYLVTRPYGKPEGTVSNDDAEAARTGAKPDPLALDLYDGALRHLDHELGLFLGTLQKRGLLAQTVLIVTGDHGEEFGEHAGHGHGHTLYGELLHVPLIIARSAAFPHTLRVDAPVSQVDLFPTIAALLRLPPPSPTAGVNLLPLLDGGNQPPGYAILAEMDNRGRPTWNADPSAPPIAYALIVPPKKYVIRSWLPVESSLPQGAREELYDLAADPQEHHNIAKGKSLTLVMRALTLQRLAQARAVGATPAAVPMDDETEKRLRALGYVH